MRPSRPKKRACEDAVWAVGHGGGVRPTPSTRRYNYNVEDLVPGKVEVTVPPGITGGDTINVNAAGQLISCRVPDGLREGDKFQVQPATQPVVLQEP